MLQVRSFVFNPFQENTFVLYDETKECVIIDPGCSDESEKSQLREFIKNEKLRVKLLLNTHCHIDHVLGNRFVKDTYKVNLLIHRTEEPILKAAEVYAPSYGFHDYEHLPADGWLEEGDFLMIGNQTFVVIFVPGHSPGHVAFYSEKNRILIGGDVLFYNSIGRTDLPGGNHQTLLNSIHTKLFTLPDYVKVYPGHGPETTIGFEKKTNPFCALNNINTD
ncbi:MAG TPA: MBL fold metallo-hydrolase [Chryseosolibacter sp.]|nr:MBL fold metallo-hydrolase [Chryseosolibacter sp.]